MKRNIAVVMGGYSSEKGISMKSGSVVMENLDPLKYNAYAVHILSDKWVVAINNEEFLIDKEDFSFVHNTIKITFDCVFNAIHGDPGENGKLIAYFDLLGLKHTSAPFYQMALTFNKRDTLSVLKQYGIKCADAIYLNKGDEIDITAIINKLKLPCFVKPNNSGSSYGISKVYKEENMQKAIDHAFTEDNEILIESFLDGTEVSVGVIKQNGQVTVLPATEIVSENDFFDYEAKYEGKSQEITPARLSNEALEKVNAIAAKVYTILNMSGMTRSEYILVDGEPYFLEMNTVPGLSNESIIPQQVRAAGGNLPDFFSSLIEARF